MEYILRWLINDIIVYSFPLIVLGAAWLLLMKLKPELVANNRSAEPLPVPIVPFAAAMYSLITLASTVNQKIADYFTKNFGAEGLTDPFRDYMPKDVPQWITMLFFVGIVAPLAEEIIFRHLLLIPLKRLGKIPAVVITALAFGAFHQNLTQLLYAVVGGVILGIAAVRANSVVPAIMIHTLSNSFDIVRSFLYDTAENNGFTAGVIILNYAVLAVFFGGLVTAIVLAVRGKLKV